jgi:tRNA G10  N-methylase Trm11
MSSNRQTIFDALGRHPIHPFPARMAPNIALAILADIKKPIRVLDPMMGSGTVLAMARKCGHRAIGVDLDPLAVLLAKVWTSAADGEEIIDKG